MFGVRPHRAANTAPSPRGPRQCSSTPSAGSPHPLRGTLWHMQRRPSHAFPSHDAPGTPTNTSSRSAPPAKRVSKHSWSGTTQATQSGYVLAPVNARHESHCPRRTHRESRIAAVLAASRRAPLNRPSQRSASLSVTTPSAHGSQRR